MGSDARKNTLANTYLGLEPAPSQYFLSLSFPIGGAVSVAPVAGSRHQGATAHTGDPTLSPKLRVCLTQKSTTQASKMSRDLKEQGQDPCFFDPPLPALRSHSNLPKQGVGAVADAQLRPRRAVSHG